MENGAQLENSSTINIKIRKHLRTIYKKMKITFILIFLITDVTSVTPAISIQDVQAVAQRVALIQVLKMINLVMQNQVQLKVEDATVL